MRRLRSIPGLLSTSAPAGSREAEHGAAALAEEVVDQEPGEEPDRAPGEPRVDVTLSNAERERLRTETDDWALERGRHGRRPAADEVSAEYERRVRAAEDLLGEMRAGLQEQYERGLRELERQREIEERERRLRESEERAQMLSIVPPAPEAGPLPNVTRRGLLTLAGLVGVQVAAAFGAAKLETRDAEATADATATAWSSGATPGTPAPVI